MSPLPVIAVFDIGKTNKKFFLFDEQYKIVLERSHQFAEITDENGDACDDLASLTHWAKQTFAEALSLPGYTIRALNFTAYGASFVHVDSCGNPVTQLYNYLKPFPADLQKEFYETYGGVEELSVTTASPVLGSLNSGLQLYRLKKNDAALFSQIQYCLHLPQYLSYLFTGRAFSDITSIGCHTCLWNFSENTYHVWVHAECIVEKLAEIWPCGATIQTLFNGREILCGTGLHDSSAALIPYLTAFTEPFVLISTGTWCISLNPFNDKPLTYDELMQDCLCYLGYDGRAIKASRIFAGHDHERQVKKIAESFNVSYDFFKTVEFNPGLVTAYAEKNVEAIDLSTCDSYEQAYHLLMYQIILQQKKSTDLVLADTAVQKIFVDGGFANNTVYMHLLASVFPAHGVFAATVSQATAIGAALCIHDQWNPYGVPADLVKLKLYHAINAAVK